MRRAACALLALLLGACSDVEMKHQQPELDPDKLVSGYTFLTPETQAQQDDDFLNPGFLWIDRGAELFSSEEGVEASCASCHGTGEGSLAGAAAHYPAIDERSGDLVNLEGRVNLCRSRHQGARTHRRSRSCPGPGQGKSRQEPQEPQRR